MAGFGWACLMGSHISVAICQYFSLEVSLAMKFLKIKILRVIFIPNSSGAAEIRNP